MQTVKKFSCGPAFAMTEVRLVCYDNEAEDDIAKMVKKFGRRRPSNGFCYFKEWEKHIGAGPIYIVVATASPLHRIFRTLPHEVCHVVGFLAERFNIDSIEEPAAYVQGYMVEAFQKALMKEYGYEVKRKREN